MHMCLVHSSMPACASAKEARVDTPNFVMISDKQEWTDQMQIQGLRVEDRKQHGLNQLWTALLFTRKNSAQQRPNVS